MREPAVFPFDKPLSNLDTKLRVQTRLEIKKLRRTLGTTSLYAAHDQVKAMTLDQFMIVMNGSRAEQIGTPAEVYARPATTLVVGFISSPPMNLLHGRLHNMRFPAMTAFWDCDQSTCSSVSQVCLREQNWWKHSTPICWCTRR